MPKYTNTKLHTLFGKYTPKTWIKIWIIIILSIVLVGIIYFFINNNYTNKSRQTSTLATKNHFINIDKPNIYDIYEQYCMIQLPNKLDIFMKNTGFQPIEDNTDGDKIDPSFTIELFIDTGNAYEDESNYGISHFVEHLVFTNTRGWSGYTKLKDMIYPFQISAVTDVDTIIFTIGAYDAKNLTIADFSKCMFVIRDMLMNADIINNPHFENERNIILREMHMHNDDINTQVVWRSLTKTFDQHPYDKYTKDIENKLVSLQNITPQMAQDFYNKYFKPENARMYIYGIIPFWPYINNMKNIDNLTNLLNSYFVENSPQLWTPTTIVQNPNTKVYFDTPDIQRILNDQKQRLITKLPDWKPLISNQHNYTLNNASQIYIYITFPLKGYFEGPDMYMDYKLNEILGIVLSRQFKDKYSYDISSSISYYYKGGYLSIYTYINPDHLTEFIDLMKKIVNNQVIIDRGVYDSYTKQHNASDIDEYMDQTIQYPQYLFTLYDENKHTKPFADKFSYETINAYAKTILKEDKMNIITFSK